MRSMAWRAGAIATATAFYFQLLAIGAPSPVWARVDPLTRIARQIHKPNMLIVLDTSGSLTGVPGGTFSTTDEVGVDCNDGVNCRGGASVGSCAASGKACTTDAQCASSTCQTGYDPCVVNSDCQPIAG